MPEDILVRIWKTILKDFDLAESLSLRATCRFFNRAISVNIPGELHFSHDKILFRHATFQDARVLTLDDIRNRRENGLEYYLLKLTKVECTGFKREYDQSQEIVEALLDTFERGSWVPDIFNLYSQSGSMALEQVAEGINNSPAPLKVNLTLTIKRQFSDLGMVSNRTRPTLRRNFNSLTIKLDGFSPFNSSALSFVGFGEGARICEITIERYPAPYALPCTDEIPEWPQGLYVGKFTLTGITLRIASQENLDQFTRYNTDHLVIRNVKYSHDRGSSALEPVNCGSVGELTCDPTSRLVQLLKFPQLRALEVLDYALCTAFRDYVSEFWHHVECLSITWAHWTQLGPQRMRRLRCLILREVQTVEHVQSIDLTQTDQIEELKIDFQGAPKLWVYVVQILRRETAVKCTTLRRIMMGQYNKCLGEGLGMFTDVFER